jgi:4-methyl-5(b-hydroxyethyl)-thiazole monophosphate biosynthesis
VQDRSYQAVILPGGMPGTTNLAESKILGALIKRHHQGAAYVAAICAAPTVLARLGVLNGKKATSYPGFEKHLTGAILSADQVVEDGKVITSRGPGTAIPFAVRLIEKLVSSAKAKEVQAAVLY